MTEASMQCIQQLQQLKQPVGTVVKMSDNLANFDLITSALEQIFVLPVDIIPLFVWFDVPMDENFYEPPEQCIDLAVEENALHLVRRTGEHFVSLHLEVTENQTKFSWQCPTKEGLIQKWGLEEDQLTDFFSASSVLSNVEYFE